MGRSFAFSCEFGALIFEDEGLAYSGSSSAPFHVRLRACFVGEVGSEAVSAARLPLPFRVRADVASVAEESGCRRGRGSDRSLPVRDLVVEDDELLEDVAGPAGVWRVGGAEPA